MSMALCFAAYAVATPGDAPLVVGDGKNSDSLDGRSSWNLPATLTTKNTNITFEVDSTWHTVHGKVKQLEGVAKSFQPSDPSAVQVVVSFPVTAMDTDNSSRDEKLYSIMASDQHPKVVFEASRLDGGCSPLSLGEREVCKGVLNGHLSIRGVKKSLQLPVEIARSTKGFKVVGKVTFNWLEYGVEDPSFILAKVDPMVTVRVKVSL
jgi:polyisoprenoid-binding protein YceI